MQDHEDLNFSSGYWSFSCGLSSRYALHAVVFILTLCDQPHPCSHEWLSQTGPYPISQSSLIGTRSSNQSQYLRHFVDLPNDYGVDDMAVRVDHKQWLDPDSL